MPSADDILFTILPYGSGHALMYRLHADETSDDDSGFICVAGYLSTSNQLRKLIPAWDEALKPLSYFHMCEGHHYTHPEVYRRLIGLMDQEHFVAGFWASVNKHDFEEVYGVKIKGQTIKYWFGGAYSFCVGAIVDLANRWLNMNNPNEQHVAYVFDAGDARQGEADMFLKTAASDPLLADRKRELRYYSHGFQDGKAQGSGALQAADILAWNLNKAQGMDRVPDEALPIFGIGTYGVTYGKDAIEECVEHQLEFCNFLGDLKRAPRVRLHSATIES